jgi:segregation and condensation protein B
MTSGANENLKLVIESILFVSDDPVELAALARVTGRREEEVAEAIEAIAAEYQGRGLRIQQTGAAVQMVTAPEAAPFVEQFLGVDEDQRISHAALETLAIIAYKQPISRQVIEAIRGVNCDRALASLKARGLVTEVGRASTAGRPYLYGTTFRFLEHFGLEKPGDLPPLPEITQEQGAGNLEKGTGNLEQGEEREEPGDESLEREEQDVE